MTVTSRDNRDRGEPRRETVTAVSPCRETLSVTVRCHTPWRAVTSRDNNAVTSPAQLSFRIDGVAVPQGSKRIGRAGMHGRPLVVDDNPKLRPWRDAVTLQAGSAARRAGWVTPARDVAVEVELSVGLPRPASAPRSRAAPVVRPDVDKLARALLDGLVDAAVLTDDAQCTRLEITKTYSADPGVDVSVNIVRSA